MRHALAALTGLPVSRPDHPRRPASLIAFPLVGALVAIVWIVTARAVTLMLGPAVAAGAILLVDLWVTRAVHLDGLASVVDGAAGGEDAEASVSLVREAVLAVPGMAAALALSLVRFAILIIAASPPGPLLLGIVPQAAFALVAVTAAGRLAMVVCHAMVPPRDDEDEPFGQPRLPVVGAALGLTVVLALPAGVRGIVGIALAVAVAVLAAAWWRRRFGGLVAELPAGVAIVAETLALAALYASV
jgi:adenosylcobinamide-GDP ribazoletransferase